MADVSIAAGGQRDGGRADSGPAVVPASLAVAWDRAEGLVTGLIEATYGPDGKLSRLDWRQWGPEVARALLDVLHGLDVMLPEARPMLPVTRMAATGDPDLLADLTAGEASELALRLGSAWDKLNPMPAGTPDRYEQILAELRAVHEQAMDRAGSAWRAFGRTSGPAGAGQDLSGAADGP